MDAHTELAVKKYFDNNTEMEVDVVDNDGNSEVVTYSNYYELINDYNNDIENQYYMPI